MILSKTLGKGYKNPNLPHVKVRDNMRKRNPGSEPQVGNRVPYVIIRNGKDKAFEKSEDPEYVIENNIPIDYRYYFDRQLLKPVSDLLYPLVKDPKLIFSELLIKCDQGRCGNILDFFKQYKKTIPSN